MGSPGKSPFENPGLVFYHSRFKNVETRDPLLITKRASHDFLKMVTKREELGSI